MTKKQCTIFLDDGNCRACVVTSEESFWADGLTLRNVQDFITRLTDRSFHVTLYEVRNEKFFGVAND